MTEDENKAMIASFWEGDEPGIVLVTVKDGKEYHPPLVEEKQDGGQV